jgi:hypothetical protein
MKKYFNIRLSWDPKVKGIRDGSYQVELIVKNVKDQTELQKIQKHFSWLNYWNKESYEPTFHLPLEGYELRSKGKLTDFLDYCPSYAGCPFMINNKVSECLKNFHIYKHFLLPIEITDGENIIREYSLLNLIYTPVDILDFPRCVFRSGHEISNNVQYYSFETFSAFQDSGVYNKTPDTLAFNNQLDQTLDMFETRVGGLMISERLLNELELQHFTGYEYKEVKIIS